MMTIITVTSRDSISSVNTDKEDPQWASDSPVSSPA